ncbi:hypothetical protein LPJ73_000873 [Coemansia sp. RSA 2703]|nr:hypothetical protein LPJ73_000873 [Coemansia sp. RSA 2703]
MTSDQPLCKYTVPFPTPSAQWTAGQSVTVQFQNDGAAHGGGHCQFSMSYDSGNTFVMVHEELKYCFFGHDSTSNTAEILSYTFNLPEDLPSSDTAVFAWTWIDAISGGPEFYMNCADVAISGTSTSYTGKEIVIANYKDYPTIYMQGNHEYGLEYYQNSKTITVTGNGKTSSSGAGSNAVKNNSVSLSSSTSTSTSTSASSSSEADNNDDEIPTPIYEYSGDDSSSSKSSATKTSLASSRSSSSTLSSSSTSSSSEETSTSTSSKSSSRSAAATSSAVVAVAPAGNVGSGSCASGEMRCASDRTNFDTCANNVWVTRPCAPGTTCQDAYVDTNPCMP